MTFPDLPGLGAFFLRKEGNLSSSESSGAAEIIYFLWPLLMRPLALHPQSLLWSQAAQEGSEQPFPLIVLLALLSHSVPCPLPSAPHLHRVASPENSHTQSLQRSCTPP